MSKLKESEPTQKRLVKGLQNIWHDLFKLTPAKMVKNVSFNENPVYQDVLHQHFFHTIDSSGRVQTKTHEVGGHFHDVKVIKQEDGKHPTLEISRAKVMVKIKKNGQFTNVSQDIEFDDHTHDYEYVRSEEIELRQVNPEAVKVQTIIELKGKQQIDGIQSR